VKLHDKAFSMIEPMPDGFEWLEGQRDPSKDVIMAGVVEEICVGGVPMVVITDPRIPPSTLHFSAGPAREQNVTITGLDETP